MENAEQTTTLDALDASLGDLLKAASQITGESLNKGDGVNIDNSGTIGSDGKQGGGQGSMSDAGKVEDLMIGKLTAAGFNAAQVNSIVGMMKDASGGSFFSHTRPSPTGGKGDGMSGKAGKKPPMPPFAGAADGDFGDPDEEEEEDEDEEPQAGGPAMRGKRVGKSLSFDEQFRQDPDIGEVVDVAPFMEALTARTTEALDTLNGRIRKSAKRGDTQFAMLAKSLVAMGTLVKSQQAVISEMGRRLGVVEKQPLPQKGVTQVGPSGAQPMQKSMPGEAGAGGSKLRKSEVASVLTYMNLEKGIREIGGRKTSEVVGLVESSSEVPEAALVEAQNFLRRNPGEAALAKSYA